MEARSLFTIPAFPRVAMSRAVGAVCRWRIPKFIRRPLWNKVIKGLGISHDTISCDLVEFSTFLELFTRTLPEGSRPIADNDHWLSPADGRLIEHAVVSSELSLILKGAPYSIGEMLPGADAAQYLGYQALQIYLAPYNYHRYHSPCDMQIISAVTEPGDLQPVDPQLMRRSMRAMKTNRRILLHCLDGSGRPFALLYVGALNVGGMKFSFDDSLGATPWHHSARTYDPVVSLNKGDDMGCFEMGSTVVMFAPPQLLCKAEIGATTTARKEILFSDE
ncbi:MAG: phosphatidylserine decarboxylase [Planctomycetes bacterium]|nr:phosphatidylserine decarboxylase [Planctomycetota bacterium]